MASGTAAGIATGTAAGAAAAAAIAATDRHRVRAGRRRAPRPRTSGPYRRSPSDSSQQRPSGQEAQVARYPPGQPVRVLTTVRDVTGALTDAGTLTLTVKIAQADGT